MCHAQQAVAEPIGNPDVPLTIDAKTAAVESNLEIIDLRRIGGRETRDVVDAAIRYPDPVLLVDAEVKWRFERLARLRTVTLANNSSLGDITIWEIHELAFLDPEHPDIAPG